MTAKPGLAQDAL